MTILKQFFKGQKKNKSLQSTENLSVETLKQLIPVRNLSDEKLQSFALENKPELINKGVVLFKAGEASDSILYLLRGSVSLADENGKSFSVEGESANAKFPLSSGARYITTATAATDISIIRVSQKIMSIGMDDTENQQHLNIPDDLSQNRLVQAFSQHYLDDELEIPSFPSIALKLRKAMQSDIGVADAVQIIQLDPVISAKLIQVANCPLYLTANPAKSCFDAVNRIGLNATRNLVVSLSIKQVFNSSSKTISSYLEKIWKQSIYISSICFVLAKETKQVNAEEALLAGLVCDIGLVPFLNFAANLPDDYYTEADLDLILPYIRGPIGRNVLRKWDFPEEIINIPNDAENWFQHTEGKLNLTDIVVLSRLHSQIGRPEMAHLPAITSIPAAGKLASITLSPENSLQLLHKAKNKINDALHAFSD